MRFPLVVLIVVITYCSVLVPSAWSQSTPPDIQLAAAAATILYFPFKAAFALGGGIAGGFAYVFSGFCETTAKSIWIPSLYGTYIITPEHLSLDRPIHFLGVAAESEGMPTEGGRSTCARYERALTGEIKLFRSEIMWLHVARGASNFHPALTLNKNSILLNLVASIAV